MFYGTSKPPPDFQWRTPQSGAPSLNCPQCHLSRKAVHVPPTNQASAGIGSDGSCPGALLLRARPPLSSRESEPKLPGPRGSLLLQGGFPTMWRAVGGPCAGFGVVSASAASLCPSCLHVCLGRAAVARPWAVPTTFLPWSISALGVSPWEAKLSIPMEGRRRQQPLSSW